MFGKQLFELFLGAGVGKVSDEQSARLCNIFLFFIFLQSPGEVPVDLSVPFVSLGFLRVVHAENLNVPPAWNPTFTGLLEKTLAVHLLISTPSILLKKVQ